MPTDTRSDPLELAPPLARATAGQLHLSGGAGTVHLSADTQPGIEAGTAPLCRLRFHGDPPRVHTDAGTVDVHYPHSAASRHERSAGIALNPQIPWSITLTGGLNRLCADLGGLALRAVEISGGSNRLDLRLPAPTGNVPVRISGGVNQLTLTRPKHVALVLRLTGGASHVSLDGQHLGHVGGHLRWTSHADGQPHRCYTLDLTGGANRVSLTLGTPA